jgi:hypothetical protein
MERADLAQYTGKCRVRGRDGEEHAGSVQNVWSDKTKYMRSF